MTQAPSQVVQRTVVFAVIFVFLILPFTTPVAVLIGSHLQYLWTLQAWKEIVLLLVGLLVLCTYPVRHFFAHADRKTQLLAWLVVAYAGWTILWGVCNLLIFERVSEQAFAYSLVVNLRFLFFFLLCLMIASYSPVLAKQWRTLIFIPAVVVVGFGLLQLFALPTDFLRHFGYGPNTIPAYHLIDEKVDYVRLQSTLRGPNPLGVYLILVVAVLVVGLRTAKNRWQRITLLAGAGVVLFSTYSRSAWLGLAATLAALLYLGIQHSQIRRLILLGSAAFFLIFAGGAYVARNSDFVQNTLFHTDETSLSPESANAERTRALQQGVSDVLHEPLGRGPGSAGPASIHNDQPERIAENYYLQVGQETGWIGLGLFLAVNILMAILLWERRNQALAAVLFATLIGISITNLVSHAWTDEAIALLWWGLAGISIAATAPLGTHDKAMR